MSSILSEEIFKEKQIQSQIRRFLKIVFIEKFSCYSKNSPYNKNNLPEIEKM